MSGSHSTGVVDGGKLHFEVSNHMASRGTYLRCYRIWMAAPSEYTIMQQVPRKDAMKAYRALRKICHRDDGG
jgi:hypothetical protein